MIKFWNHFSSWEEAEKAWDEGTRRLSQKKTLSIPLHLPQIPGIIGKTKRFLKLKSLFYLLRHDTTGGCRRHVFKKPLKYGVSYLKSALKRTSYRREGDFFYYGLKTKSAFFKEGLNNSLLVLGFSFCQKPLECPSGRFNDHCLADPLHPVCRQCVIGKAIHSLPHEKVIPVLIPTIHYIGEKLFDLLEKHPNNQLFFLITACELSLSMFSDFGNMIGIQGIGVRLNGRICNTFEAFKLAEKGIKPGRTLFTQKTEYQFFRLLQKINKTL